MGETSSNPRNASPAQPTERVRDSLGLLLGAITRRLADIQDVELGGVGGRPSRENRAMVARLAKSEIRGSQREGGLLFAAGRFEPAPTPSNRPHDNKGKDEGYSTVEGEEDIVHRMTKAHLKPEH